MKKILFPFAGSPRAKPWLISITTLTLLTPLATRADEELKIGVVAAESGSFVSAGNANVAGANLAAEQIHYAGGGEELGESYKIESLNSHNLTRANGRIAFAPGV